jgi:hypothetical protein
MLKKLSRIDARAVCLTLGTFFLPFGYDALFRLFMKLTGSYWAADAIFYGISLSFFGLYFWLSRRDQLRSTD